MPSSPCLEPGCPNVATYRGRCEDHYRERTADLRRRVSGFAIYATKRWRAVRRQVLRRDRYTCQHCGRWGNEVDHIVPIQRGGPEWELSNLQTLCKRCHSRKTAKETWHDGP